MEFELSIDPRKFQSTNLVWNRLRLNDPWSVGYVSRLIESKPFDSKEEWEEFYYKSGADRNLSIGHLSQDLQKVLDNFLLPNEDENFIKAMPHETKALNLSYGRTKDQLVRKAEVLRNSAIIANQNLSLDECIECVRFRVICETWNGIILRERNTIEALSKMHPKYEFRKVSAEIDHTYAVDYEVYLENVLRCAIQIKPISYTYNTPYINTARMANRKKNLVYAQDFGASVFDIISDTKGNIQNIHLAKDL